MSTFLSSARVLIYDMASTIFFVAIVSLTNNVKLAIALGMALGIGQIAAQLLRKKPIDYFQWVSLGLVVLSGTASLLTNNPIFAEAKASVIYVFVGVSMLHKGWMNRYLPDVAQTWVPDVAIVFGYVWAGLMFLSAVVNLVLAKLYRPAAWGEILSIYGVATKTGLFLVQYATMRAITVRRRALAEAAPAR